MTTKKAELLLCLLCCKVVFVQKISVRYIDFFAFACFNIDKDPKERWIL